MGHLQSKPISKSPSAAFGRLRIDSPALSQGSIRSIRARQVAVRAVNASDQVLGDTSRGIGLLSQSWDDLRKASRSGSSVTEQSQLVIDRRKLQQYDYQSTPTGTTAASTNAAVAVIETGSPEFIIWIGPALVCAMFYALYNIFIKLGSSHINPVLGGVVLQFVAALVGTILLTALVVFQSERTNQDALKGLDGDDDGGGGGSADYRALLMWDWLGIQWAICAGISVGMAEILSFIVSGMGVQAMQSIPIIIGGSVLFGTILGFLLLNEDLTSRGWMGVAFIALGIALVGTDPGTAGVIH